VARHGVRVGDATDTQNGSQILGFPMRAKRDDISAVHLIEMEGCKFEQSDSA
jgi:hypothetical protein